LIRAEAWWVYLVRCADGTLYTGVTTDLPRRVDQHNRGVAARYTRGRGPVCLCASAGPMARSQALRLERQVKRLPPRQKARCIADQGPLV
jgi:putative endonuclease